MRAEEILKLVQDDQRKWGDPVRPPATSTLLSELRVNARAQLGVELPDDYIRILQRSDGLEFNGFVLYDCASTPEHRTDGFWQGLVVTNQIWRESSARRDFLIVADSDMDLYALHVPSQTWRRIDKIASDRFEVFDSCDTMLVAALRARI
jgi:hypothetical protein